LKNYRKHIDDFFREKLGNYRETPPPEVWDSLETRLDSLATGGGGFHLSYRWLSHFAIVSVILFFGASLVKKMTGASIENISLNEKAIAQTLVLKHNEMPVANNSAPTAATIPVPAVNEAPDNQNSTAGTAITTQAQNKTGNGQIIQKQAASVSAKKQAGGNKTRTLAKQEKEPRQDVNYTRNSTKPGPAEETNDNSQALVLNASAAAGNKKQEPAVEENKVKLPSEIADKKEEAILAHNKPSSHRIEAGLKLGYERGFDNSAATKYVVSPYLQYNLSSRVSLMIQPAIKSASFSTRSVGKPQAYYKENNDGAITQVGDVTKNYLVEGGTRVDSQYTATYNYSQTHDSTVKAYSIGGTFIEFELPLLLKYAVTQSLSVYGGVNINYSKLVGLTESSTTVQGIKVSIDSTNTSSGAPAHLPLNSVITYHGNSLAEYQGVTAPGSMLRFGYTLGLSYEYSNRWLFDALMQQAPVKPDMQHGYNVNTTVSSPYFRLSIGYKLIK
jgi:hypothetical protein